MSTYPEHEKVHKIKDYSQQIGLFLDWMVEDGVVLSRTHKHGEHCYEDGDRVCGTLNGELAFDYEPINKRLARYFDIDEAKLEREKREMLAELRDARANRSSVA